LREAARLVLPVAGRSGWDYVLIGRRDVTADRPFDRLLDDLRQALARIHR
jgi:ribonuclease P protein component